MWVAVAGSHCMGNNQLESSGNFEMVPESQDQFVCAILIGQFFCRIEWVAVAGSHCM